MHDRALAARQRMVLAACVFAAVSALAWSQAGSRPRADVLDEVDRLVRAHFFRSDLNRTDWPREVRACRERLAAADTSGAGQAIGDLLRTLDASHTQWYSTGNPHYYELADLYRHALGDDLKRVFPDGIVRHEVSPSQWIIPHEQFLETMRRSVRVIEREGRRLGCVHMPCWAGDEYQQLLEGLLNAEPLRSCDGLILDIRGGWGGASPDAIGLFGCDSPTLELIARDGGITRVEAGPPTTPRERQWRKPVTLLVDEGTRSGKEVFAHAFRKQARGRIVGVRTAGAVLAGKPFLLSDGSLLVLAVADVRIDGTRLEGIGIQPDVSVVHDPTQAERDSDRQFQRAAEVLCEQLASQAPNAASRPQSQSAILPDVAKSRFTVIFSGRVQGVGFRATTEGIARRFDVTGWVRNERDGSVLCVAEGDDAELGRFLTAIRQAMQHNIGDEQITRSSATGEFADFRVRY